MPNLHTLLAGAAMLIPCVATAQPECAQHDLMLGKLKNYHDQHPVYTARTGGRVTLMVEMTLSKDGAWTLLLSYPDGRTCMVANGFDWERTGFIEPGKEG